MRILPDLAIPLIVWVIIQIIKIALDFAIQKKRHVENLRAAWWFPSVHSGISTSLTTLFFFKFGLYSPEFTICFIFSLLFWYDAMSVRWEAWQHAKYINKLSWELKTMLNFQASGNLKERLWHTLIEVLWGIVIWFAVTVIIYYLFISA